MVYQNVGVIQKVGGSDDSAVESWRLSSRTGLQGLCQSENRCCRIILTPYQQIGMLTC